MKQARSSITEDNEDDPEDDYGDITSGLDGFSITDTLSNPQSAADTFAEFVNEELSEAPRDSDGLRVRPKIYDHSALPSRRTLVQIHVRLPPPDVARRLFAAQYTYIGTIFAFTDPARFDQELIEAYRGQPDLGDKAACLSYAKVLVTLAFGKLYSVNQWIDYQGPPGFEYFSQALQLLPDAHEEGSILGVETLTLIGYFMQNMNRHDAAFLYVGMALRMAISLGLHQEVAGSHGAGLDEEAREHRRRVWWSVYSMDRILSIKSGNPITIHDEDIGVNLPSKLPGEKDYCPAVVLRHYTELSRILGEVTKSIYRSKLPGDKDSTPAAYVKAKMESVKSIMGALNQWDRKLPDELRFDPAKLSTSRESVSTFSHYYQCINMTARPLLSHVVRTRLQAIRADPEVKERDWKAGLSTTTVGVIESCITAAEETIRLMAEARACDLLATYGYMDGEHVFSAAIVLVLVCAALPSRPSSTKAMNAGLDLLREMAERGWNSHMGARYELLAHLRAVFLPGEEVPPATPAFSSPTSAAWSAVRSPAAASLVAAQAAGMWAVESPAHARSGSIAFSAGESHVGHGGGLGGLDGMPSPFSADPTGNLAVFEGLPENPGEAVGYADVDFMMWEEGFANPVADASDFSQWNLNLGA